MSAAFGVLALLLLAAAGWWPMRRLAGPLAGTGFGGRLGAALALGAILTGLVQFVLSLLGFPAGWLVPVLLAGVSLLLCAGRVGLRVASARDAAHAAADVATNAPHDSSAAPAARRWERLLLAGLLLGAIVSAGAGVGTPFKGDGGKFWASRARELSLSGAPEAPSIVDETRMGFHRGYPLLVPLLLAPVFAVSPQDAAAGPKLVLQGLAWALLLLLGSLLLREGLPGRCALLAFGTLPAWTSLEVRESLVSGGYADVALALFLLLLVDTVDRLRRGVDASASRGVLLAILAAGGLLATKFEGFVAFSLVAGAWFLAGPRRAGLLPFLCGAALLAVPPLVLRVLAVEGAPIAHLSLLGDGAVLAARAPPLAAGLLGLLTEASVFGLLPLLLLWLAWRGRRELDAFVPLLVLGVAAFLVVVYLTTSMHLGRHLFTSVHRLAFHWTPVLALLLARAARRAGA